VDVHNLAMPLKVLRIRPSGSSYDDSSAFSRLHFPITNQLIQSILSAAIFFMFFPNQFNSISGKFFMFFTNQSNQSAANFFMFFTNQSIQSAAIFFSCFHQSIQFNQRQMLVIKKAPILFAC
jgi:hypothetical protein